MNNKNGFGLIEAFLSIVIISIILSCLLNNYLLLKKQIKRSTETINIYENLDFVKNLITTSIRSAGCTPCVNINRLVTWDHRFNNKLNAISFINNDKSWIKTSKMDENFTEAKVLNHNTILLYDNLKIDLKDSVIIADCFSAEIQNISNILFTKEGIKITFQNSLKFHYHKPVYIGLIIEEKYFINKTKYTDASLFYSAINSVDELSADIRQMEISTLSNDLFYLKLISEFVSLDVAVKARCL